MKISVFVDQNKRHHRPEAVGNRNQLQVENQNLSEPQDKIAVTVALLDYLSPHGLLISSCGFSSL